MEKQYEYIVIGSGATGAIAAKTLVEAGKETLVIDPGVWNEEKRKKIPDLSWEEIRKTDTNQHSYFLGDDFEGIVWEESRVGSQLTPPRTYLKEKTEQWLPFLSNSFFPFESMAKGGLGGGWGTGCFVFSNPELDQCGLDPKTMEQAYRQVASWIGMSGQQDDGSNFAIGNLKNLQTPLPLDSSMLGIFSNYDKHKETLQKQGFWLGRSGMALLSEPIDGRKASQGYDMEFWGDNDYSAYRSWMTIDQLLSKPNFTLVSGWMAIRFEEDEGGVTVWAQSLETNEVQAFKAKKLIIAAGVLSTARLVLRSQEAYQHKLPVLCNAYTYMPTINWSNLGLGYDTKRSGLCQAILFRDTGANQQEVAQAALFGYRQLLLFKLAKEAPLGFAFSKEIMRLLESAFIIAGIHHPEQAGGEKWIELVRAESYQTGDVLRGEYRHSQAEENRFFETEKAYKKALFKLGCLPLKAIRTPQGGSIHYAGTLPFSDSDQPFHIQRNGRLNGFQKVFVGDGSGFRYLPAKGLTLSLMANAFLVANAAMEH
ncbi:MAG: hypothetical protein K1X82_02125 [Bacteroidia bacterium]|nr:hypothetical protein [Bacteroidia bacterium]